MASQHPTDENLPTFRIIVVGDEEIGKTCLLIAYRSDSSQSLPSVFQGIKINKTITRNNIEEHVTIKLCDSSSDDINTSFRVGAYKKCHICLVCFDILKLKTLQSISTKWIPEIKQYAPQNCLILLVGLKSDLRGSQSDEISLQQINEFKSKHNIMEYIETSALKKTNVDKAFEIGIETSLESQQYRDSRGISTVSSMDDIDADTTKNSVMDIHNKQWNQHLKSVYFDSSDAVAALRQRDNTDISLAAASTAATQSPIIGSTDSESYNVWQQQYRNSAAYNMAMQQRGMSTQQMQQRRIGTNHYPSYQQQYIHNEDNRERGTVSSVADSERDESMFDESSVSMTLPIPADKKEHKKESIIDLQMPNHAKVVTESEIRAVEIDYMLMEEEKHYKNKRCCNCIVL